MGKNRVGTRLRLLLWKNWQVRRRRLCSLIGEFVILFLVIILCALIWYQGKANDRRTRKKYDKLGFHEVKEPAETFPEQDINLLLGPVFNRPNRSIFYSPNHGKAQMIIDKLKAKYEDEGKNYNFTGERNWTGFENEEDLIDKHLRMTLVNITRLAKDPPPPEEEVVVKEYDENAHLMLMALIIDAPEGSNHWSYKIRMPETFGKSNIFEESLYSKDNSVGGHKEKGGEGYPQEINDYVSEGFIGMQLLMDTVMTEMLTGDPESLTDTRKISLQSMPYPAYKYYEFREYLRLLPLFLSWFIVLPYLVTFVVTIRMILEEKESGFKELLKINGMANWMHWMGWGMNTMFTYLIISIVLTILLTSTGFIYVTPFYVFFFLLFFFSLSWTTLSFLVSSLFQRPTVGSYMGLVIVAGTLGGVMAAMDEGFKDLSDAEKYACCLVPHGAIWLAARIITSYKSAPTDAELNQSFHLGHVILMLIVTAVFYMILALYFENILPSKFGARKPFYYPVSGIFKRNKVKAEVGEVTGGKDGSFEPEPEELEKGVAIQKLTKLFHRKTAVDQVSLNIFKGQITVLLGHNGAGKTTLISMLTGITRPSSGTALINGHDIIEDLVGARESLSVCPQENRLLGKLTVAEHFKLFGQLKGLTAREAKEKSIQLAKQMGLEEKLKVATENLSGGQMRKVQLGMSILGNTQVVFLDEPSSGIDPESRRHIWDLIAAFRKDRTIVLTTHHMEEADVLGDRIAIMSNGKIKCFGSTVYLKKLYGQGYTLKLVISEKNLPPDQSQSQAQMIEKESESKDVPEKEPQPDQAKKFKNKDSPTSAEEILNVLQGHVAGAKLVKVNRDVDKKEVQLDFNVPVVTEDADQNNIDVTTKFTALFSQLEKRKQDLAIISMGLAYTNMDDVFQKVAEDEHKSAENNTDEIQNSEQNKVVAQQAIENTNPKPPAVGLCCRRLQALLIKRLLMMIKSKGLLVAQIVLSVVIFALALVIIGGHFEEKKENSFKPIAINLSAYNDPWTYFTSTEPKLTEAFKTAVKLSKGPEPKEVKEDLLALYRQTGKDIPTYLNRLVVGAALDETHYQGFAAKAAYHSQPLAINLLRNTMLAKIAANKSAGTTYSISVVNHPVRRKYEKTEKALIIVKLYDFTKKSKGLLDVPNFTVVTDWLYTLIFGFLAYYGLAILAASFVVLPVDEKLSKAKQIQRIAGVGPVTYYLSFLICDLGLIFLVSGLLISMVPVVNAFGYQVPYAHNNGLGVLYFILVVFGVNVISLSYLFSLRASSPSGGFIFLMLVHCLLVPVYLFTLLIVALVFASSGNMELGQDLLKWGATFFLVFPAWAVILCLQKFNLVALVNTACDRLPEMTQLKVCKFPDRDDELTQKFSMCCKPPRCGSNCFKPLSFFPEYSESTIAFFIIFLLFEALFFAGVLLLIEGGGCRALKKLCKRGVQTIIGQSNFLATTDADVKNEAMRVDLALASNNKRTDAFYASHFNKKYGNFMAVSDLSFGVHYGECFGLLGVNGAGKTTMFKMLTGDEIPSSGEALIEGMYSLSKHRKTFLGKIGFCPQFDAILPQLTGRQMLSLMCSIRGVYQRSVKDEVQQWLVKMGLEKSGNVACGNYSGGMKRKLSAAMALIGNPPIVLLDEPSTGVDPQARRQFWKILSAVQNKGQAIILTSHSMDECEVLCNRLGVMVNGQMQCFGRFHFVKPAKFYKSTLKLKEHVIKIIAMMGFAKTLSQSVEHLKKKFAHGYTATITLKHSEENSRLIMVPAPGPAPGQAPPPGFNQPSVPAAAVRAPAPAPQSTSVPVVPPQASALATPQVSNPAMVPKPISAPVRPPVQAQGPPPPGPLVGQPQTQFVNTQPPPGLYVTLGHRRLMAHMNAKFPKCELKDAHQNIFQIQIKDTNISLSTIFSIMEGIKKESPGLVEEYSVSDTTLEQIFLSFARMQYPDRQDRPKSCCKKCLGKCGLG